MGLGGILRELQIEGVLALYHDYRAGHTLDLSGTGNNGTLTGTWTKNGVHCRVSGANITVADAASLQLTVGTLALLADFETFDATTERRLISKRGAGGTNYDLRAINSNVTLYDGVNTRFITTTTNGVKFIAVNFGDGTTAEGFFNGSSRGLFSGNSSITANNQGLQICNTSVNPLAFLGSPAYAAVIVSRKLTAAEHARLYYDLARVR